MTLLSASSEIAAPVAGRRAAWFVLALLTILSVGDGWSGRPGGLSHQLLLLPFTGVFLFSIWNLLFARKAKGGPVWTSQRSLALCIAFELLAVALVYYEARHFAALGYRVDPFVWIGFCALLLAALVLVLVRRLSPEELLAVLLGAYSLGVLLAVLSFPLNYLRSDMLAVIFWADRNLLHGISPYATMYVGGRVYDFPYLPGMLVAYLPLVALHVDLRWASIVALAVTSAAVFCATLPMYRRQVVGLLGVFLLNPFLQYRHDLYLQPHWLTIVGAFLLLQRRRYLWGAFVLGLGMAMYQFSWIMLPFFLLNAWWRRRWLESLKVAGAAIAGTLLFAGPFLRSAATRITSNTVGQWGRFPHAIADPMNVSYWLTYAVHPDKLLRLQALLMVAIFVGCVLRRRCATLEDTLRWTVVALTVFILCNSIVDGYFFLMLLVPMLLFTLVANGWLKDPLHK